MKQPVKTADIVIIGGGVMGTATAYEMAKAGLDVVLCEMRNLGSGASGRCGGGEMGTGVLALPTKESRFNFHASRRAKGAPGRCGGGSYRYSI